MIWGPSLVLLTVSSEHEVWHLWHFHCGLTHCSPLTSTVIHQPLLEPDTSTYRHFSPCFIQLSCFLFTYWNHAFLIPTLPPMTSYRHNIKISCLSFSHIVLCFRSAFQILPTTAWAPQKYCWWSYFPLELIRVLFAHNKCLVNIVFIIEELAIFCYYLFIVFTPKPIYI